MRIESHKPHPQLPPWAIKPIEKTSRQELGKDNKYHHNIDNATIKDSVIFSSAAKEFIAKSDKIEDLSKPELIKTGNMLLTDGMELNHKNITSMNNLRKMTEIFKQ